MSWTKEVDSPVLLLGLGNLLLGDDAVGIRALEQLTSQYRLPPEVRPLDGGTLGLELLTYLERASALLILDAVQSGRPPGTLIRLEGSALSSRFGLKLSVHQVDLHELVAACRLRGTQPGRVVLWGMEPAALDWGLHLSPPVAAALDDLVELAAEELRNWGVQLRGTVAVEPMGEARQVRGA
jgi:hydrogenase maturation protease